MAEHVHLLAGNPPGPIGELFVHGLADEAASDPERHAILLRCRDCGDLYECFPEGRAAPRRLSISEARSAFPGAV